MKFAKTYEFKDFPLWRIILLILSMILLTIFGVMLGYSTAIGLIRGIFQIYQLVPIIIGLIFMFILVVRVALGVAYYFKNKKK